MAVGRQIDMNVEKEIKSKVDKSRDRRVQNIANISEKRDIQIKLKMDKMRISNISGENKNKRYQVLENIWRMIESQCTITYRVAK